MDQEWQRGERGGKLREKTKKDQDRMAIRRQREGKGISGGKHFITTLLLQLSYLQSNNRGPGSAGRYSLPDRTAA